MTPREAILEALSMVIFIATLIAFYILAACIF